MTHTRILTEPHILSGIAKSSGLNKIRITQLLWLYALLDEPFDVDFHIREELLGVIVDCSVLSPTAMYDDFAVKQRLESELEKGTGAEYDARHGTHGLELGNRSAPRQRIWKAPEVFIKKSAQLDRP
jgi:hypothetical protein